MDSTTSLIDAGRTWLQRRALLFKIIGIGFLALILLIPLAMVDSTLNERKQRSAEAVASITQTWGRAQRLIGPVLVVPYSYQSEVEETNIVNGQRVTERVVREFAAEAYFLPEQLAVTGDLQPSERQRGIYRTQVYTGTVRVSGHFAPPAWALLGLAADNVRPHWNRARLSFAVSDLRGMREAVSVTWGEQTIPLQPGARLEGFSTGLHAPLTLMEGGGAQAFAVDLTLNGSESFSVVPLGRETRVSLTSPWQDPSFIGAYLPTERTVDAQGFKAAWQVSYYGRDFPQQWTDRAGEPRPSLDSFSAAAFGVNLLPSVDAYRTVERSIKYGVLFVALVFTAFFLFEATLGLRLNALNYLLVGAALCLFFLSLLALSEFMPFGVAYGVAALDSIALVGLYCWRVLSGGRRAVLVSAMLGGVYVYLYFVLNMEDFSLLAGTGALFAMLAAVMYATRSLGAEETPSLTTAVAPSRS
ncbi:MAG TPA: cell envelope integrity protein CreD [Opitutaceae bacterium]